MQAERGGSLAQVRQGPCAGSDGLSGLMVDNGRLLGSSVAEEAEPTQPPLGGRGRGRALATRAHGLS